MCEPNHSIVQYPGYDDSGPLKPRLEAALKGAMTWGKKIMDWFHFSKMGAGHSAATEKGRNAELYLPAPTSYEAQWWIRKVSFDGEFRGNDWQRAEALQCAEEYACRTSIGDLKIFRRFFEESVKKTYSPLAYILAFRNMLNIKGNHVLNSKLKSVSKNWFHELKGQRDIKFKASKICLGLTRKRDLLVSEWADNKELWTPNS